MDPKLLRPQHKVWEPNVEVPTIFVDAFREGHDPEVSFQWFGESDSLGFLEKDFGEEVSWRFGRMQFRFPIPMRIDDIHWMNHPEHFRVVFLGQGKDWPKTGKAPGDDLESWWLWVVSTHYTTMQPSGEGPGSFATPLNAMLGDGVYGIIRPKQYFDIEVLNKEVRRVDEMRRKRA